jgi:hypothetical protein
MSLVKSYTSWQPLEEVIVGRVYPPDYFDFIEDPQVRAQMQTILSESEEDLNNLQKILESHGVVVQRPDVMSKIKFEKSQQDYSNSPLPPLTPRDWQITLGERLLRVIRLTELDHICQRYFDVDPNSVVNPHGADYDFDHVLVNAVASCIVRVGRDVFFDRSDYFTVDQMHWIRDNVLDERYRVHHAVTEGHGDAVFAILKPGVILSTMHDINIDYQKDFPGWEVLRIVDSTIDAAMEVGKFRYESLDGKWYLPGEKPSPQFAKFVDTYLKDWTGFVKETVFDVNCLVLDESHVIFSNYNKTVFDFCEKHKIEPIICEQRHKYFWDGGISCCTQDIRRKGELESYL